LKHKETQIENMKEQHGSMQTAADSNFEELNNIISDKDAKIDELKKLNEALEEKQAAHDKVNGGLEKSLAASNKAKIEAQNKIVKVFKQLKVEKEDRKMAEKKLREENRRSRILQQETVDDLRHQLSQKVIELEDMAEKMRDLNEKKERLETRYDELEKDLQEVQQNEAIAEEVADMEKKLRDKQREVDKGLEKLQDQQTKLFEAEADLKQAKEDLRLKEQQFDEILEKYEEAETAKDSLEANMDSQKSDREDTEKRLAQLIQIRQKETMKYEKLLKQNKEEAEKRYQEVATKYQKLQDQIAAKKPLTGEEMDEEFLSFAKQQANRDTEMQAFHSEQKSLRKKLQKCRAELQKRERQCKKYERAFTELDRSKKRSVINIDYLKNVIVQFLQMSDSLTEEQTTLIPVIATILQFSATDRKRIDRSYFKPSLNPFFDSKSQTLFPTSTFGADKTKSQSHASVDSSVQSPAASNTPKRGNIIPNRPDPTSPGIRQRTSTPRKPQKT